jgi:hypothetical protein
MADLDHSCLCSDSISKSTDAVEAGNNLLWLTPSCLIASWFRRIRSSRSNSIFGKFVSLSISAPALIAD